MESNPLSETLPPPPNRRPQFGTGYFVNRTARLMARWGDARLRPLGMGVAQLPVMGLLWQGPSTQKELAQRIHIEQPTMAEMLSRMERSGLITRSPDTKDKRSSRVSLTDRASTLWPEAEAILLEGAQIALRGLSDDEVTTLNGLLQRVVNNLDAALAAPDESDTDQSK